METTAVIIQIDINPDMVVKEKRDVSTERYHRKLMDHSIDTVSKYAALHNFDHLIYHNQTYPACHPQIEKLRPIFEDHPYDYIIVMDGDIIITTEDNIIDDCRIDRLNYTPRTKEENKNPSRDRMYEFNSGCFVIGKDIIPYLREYVDPIKANAYKNHDQTELQYFLNAYQWAGHAISPYKWNNYIDLTQRDCFLHFKGGRRYKAYEEFNNSNLHRG